MNLVDVDGHGFWGKLWNSFSQNCFCEGEQLDEFTRRD